MKKPSMIAAAIVLILFVIGNSNCSKSSSSTNTPAFHVQLQTSATLGSYLVDKNGHALYFFINDVKGQSTCTGQCELNWPVVSDSNLTAAELGTGLTLTDFSTIKTSEGKTQLTYKGWPLYNFSPAGAQEAAGQVTGDDVGPGIFFVAKPDYTIMLGSTQLVGLDGNNYVAPSTLGTGNSTYFTDAWGATLYLFAIDSANHNRFTKSDFSNNTVFPIYDTTNVVVPSALTKTLFTTTAVFGKSQLSFNGWPLYYFGADSSHRGSTKAVSIGPNKWPVVTQSTPAAPHP
jgi:predicted lipoprotein with Yx(FWY)xxD motif